MNSTSNKHGAGVADVLEQTLAGDETVLVVNPAAETVSELVDVVAELDGDREEIQLLATDRALKDAFEDFLVASSAADLVQADALSLRTADLSHNTLLVTSDVVFALVAVEQQAGALASSEEAFVDGVESTYRGRWNDASQFQLRTPPISRVRKTLQAEIGPDTREDFDRLLEALESIPEARHRIDEVTISLLVAAKNDVLLYDISRWGEDVGIASKATFSRTKTRLEDHNLIDTEKVPIEVGRPRLRLQLADHLSDASPDQLLETVQAELES